MKTLTAILVAALGIAFGTNAFAQSTPGGLTRADVYKQLVQAQADGIIPAGGNNYPPSALSIAHNRAVWAASHRAAIRTATDTAPGMDQGTTSSN